MKHYLVTRFNLTVEEWKVDRNNSPVLTMEWLDDRFSLFQELCYPSVLNQTSQEFKWLVYFDTLTPQHYKDLVLDLALKYNNFTPLFINGAKELHQSICDYILMDAIEEEYVLTTRIDNDDAIHKDFVITVQNLSSKQHGLVIDIRKGYQILKNHDIIKVRESIQSFNPFISVVQKKNNYKSIYLLAHTEWSINKYVIVHSEQPLWIQLIHGRNKVNRINRHNKLVSNLVFEDFGIQKMRMVNIFYIFSYNFLLYTYKKLFRLVYKT